MGAESEAARLLRAFEDEAGPLDFGDLSGVAKELLTRWRKYSKPGCSHAGMHLASAAGWSHYCAACVNARGMLARWTAIGSCASCGRHVSGERNISLLSAHGVRAAPLLVVAVMCDACSPEPT